MSILRYSIDDYSQNKRRTLDVQPLKYPLVFRAAELLVVSKTDLLPYLAFDSSKAKTWAQEINPGIRILELSAKTLYGFEGWTNFLFERIEALGLKHAGPWS